jgi:hypothetical protein
MATWWYRNTLVSCRVHSIRNGTYYIVHLGQLAAQLVVLAQVAEETRLPQRQQLHAAHGGQDAVRPPDHEGAGGHHEQLGPLVCRHQRQVE